MGIQRLCEGDQCEDANVPSATEEEIKGAQTSDVYFERTREILEKEGLSNIHVTAETTTGSLPKNWEWGILAGIEEASNLLEGLNIRVRSFPEGTLFHPVDCSGVREPVMIIEGRYLDFCLYETPLLGLLCQASGMQQWQVESAGQLAQRQFFHLESGAPILPYLQ